VGNLSIPSIPGIISRRSSSIAGHHQSQVIISRRSSSVAGHHQSQVIIKRRSSSIAGHQSQVIIKRSSKLNLETVPEPQRLLDIQFIFFTQCNLVLLLLLIQVVVRCYSFFVDYLFLLYFFVFLHVTRLPLPPPLYLHQP